MKIRTLILCVLSLFAISVQLSPAAFSAGGQDAGGGNVFEAEFKSIGYKLYRRLERADLGAARIGFELVRLRVALQEVQVLGTDDPLHLGENTRMAINSPTAKLIVFSNSTWAILNREQKQLLVLHEYLRFVGVDDSEYSFSLMIMRALRHPGLPPGPGPSARALKFKIVGLNQLENSACGHFDAIAPDNEEVSLTACCLGYSGVAAAFQGSTLHVGWNWGYPRVPEAKKEFKSVSKCEAVVSVLRLASPEHPIELIYDPIRALTNPDELISINY